MSINSNGLTIWNRLGNSNQVLNSERGVNGTPTGITYLPVKFSGGSDVNASSEWVDFSYAPNAQGAGAVEFWWKPNYASTSTTTARILDAGTATTFRLILLWNSSSQLTFVHYDRGQIFYSPTFSADDVIHLSCVWDASGIDGTSDTTRLYYNGVDVASSTQTLTTVLNQTTMRLGNIWLNDLPGNCSFDNIKIWDYAKTDYSDRNYEGYSFANKRRVG